jgi:hypothetical protein
MKNNKLNILGLDFTSAPRARKPITVVRSILAGRVLEIHSVDFLTGFPAFEAWLHEPGPWIAGLDFPFGQPRRLVENLGWPLAWDEMVRLVGSLEKSEFASILDKYRDSQPPGDKHHFRPTDRLTGAVSPMMWVGVPVGKMFFEGAPRLAAAGVRVEPCRRTPDDRVVLETYPGYLARALIGRKTYKREVKSAQEDAHRLARRSILEGLTDGLTVQRLGLELRMPPTVQKMCVEDGRGDVLDALLCAVQAAWAAPLPNYGIPSGADPLEGWITAPLLAA